MRVYCITIYIIFMTIQWWIQGGLFKFGRTPLFPSHAGQTLLLQEPGAHIDLSIHKHVFPCILHVCYILCGLL